MEANLRRYIIAWNNVFPLDKWWRDKYKVPYKSETHLEANQADILMEYMESCIYDEYYTGEAEGSRKNELYNKGQWLSKNEQLEKNIDELFEKIEI
jgi:hypothetical protein